MKIVLSNQEVMGALQDWVKKNLPMFADAPIAFIPSLARDSQRTITIDLLLNEEATEYLNSLKAPQTVDAEPVSRTRKPKGDPVVTAPVVAEEEEEVVEPELVEEVTEEVESVAADADQPVDDEEEEEVDPVPRRGALRRRTSKEA